MSLHILGEATGFRAQKLNSTSVHSVSNRGVGLLELYMSIQINLKSVNYKDVAKASNCSVTTLHNWESGKTKAPRINTLTKVAAVLGYSIEWTRNYVY